MQRAKRNKGYEKTPGEYMGPKSVSYKYGDARGPRGYRGGGGGGGDRYGGDRYGGGCRHDAGITLSAKISVL